MTNIFKSFTYWFVILALMSNFVNYIGYDDMNIMVFALNPILQAISNSDSTHIQLVDLAARKLTMTCYVLNMITSMFYGSLIDAFRWFIKKGSDA